MPIRAADGHPKTRRDGFHRFHSRLIAPLTIVSPIEVFHLDRGQEYRRLTLIAELS